MVMPMGKSCKGEGTTFRGQACEGGMCACVRTWGSVGMLLDPVPETQPNPKGFK